MENRKAILKFILIFIITFLLIEVIEMLFEYFFHIDLHNLKWGWIGFMILYGFKYHVICCLIPAIWASYKCRHKKCNHNHCGKE